MTRAFGEGRRGGVKSADSETAVAAFRGLSVQGYGEEGIGTKETTGQSNAVSSAKPRQPLQSPSPRLQRKRGLDARPRANAKEVVVEIE